jgi:hypothetical protein
MVKIFYWGPSTDGVGHISMKLSDGTYISHWPEQGKNLSKTRTEPKLSLQHDIEAEGREPDKTFKMELKYEDKIKSWWKDFKSDGEYHLLTSNCANIVRKAVYLGTDMSSKIKWTLGTADTPIIHTPHAVFNTCQLVAKMQKNPWQIINPLNIHLNF